MMSIVNAPMLPSHYIGDATRPTVQEATAVVTVPERKDAPSLPTRLPKDHLELRRIGIPPHRLIQDHYFPIARQNDPNALLGDQMGNSRDNQREVTTNGVIRSLVDGAFIWAVTSLTGDVTSHVMAQRNANATRDIANALEATAKLNEYKKPMELGDAHHQKIIRFIERSGIQPADKQTYLDNLTALLKSEKGVKPLISDMMNGAASYYHQASAEQRLANVKGWGWLPVLLGASVAGSGIYTAVQNGKAAKRELDATNLRNSYILSHEGHDITLKQARKKYPDLYSRIQLPKLPTLAPEPDKNN